MKIKNIFVLGLVLAALSQTVAADNNTSALDTLIATLTAWLPYLIIFILIIIALLVVAKMFKASKSD